MYLLPRLVGWTACPWSATGYVGTCDATNGPTLCKSWYREFGPDSYWPMYLVRSPSATLAKPVQLEIPLVHTLALNGCLQSLTPHHRP
jgi:hypothetical protein